MKNELAHTTIYKIFKIVDSCINEEQLRNCNNISNSYARLIKNRGVTNPEVIKHMISTRIRNRENEILHL